MGVVVPLSRSPEPQAAQGGAVGPATIGDLIEAGRDLTATCEVCLHSARLNLPELAARFGAAHFCTEPALRPLLQCSVCKSTEATLQDTRPRRHGVTRPRPVDRIPAYV